LRYILPSQKKLKVPMFFGPAKRTLAMTFVAAMDGILALHFVAYLAGR
jgi:hypothetical protein